MKKLEKIAILGHYNLYESKLHFGLKFGEALERQGVQVLYQDTTQEEDASHSFKELINFKPDLTLSFNSTLPDSKKRYFWEYMRVPHLFILVDPSVYYWEVTKSTYSLFSCVDEFDVEWLRKKKVARSFFLPHAIERELSHPPETERPYDVVFIGSCYDAEMIEETAQRLFTPPLYAIYERSVKRTIEEDIPFEFIVEEELLKAGIELPEAGVCSLCSFVDFYIRGKERLDLLKAIDEVEIHVFGQVGWQHNFKSRQWQELLKDKKNIIFHPPIPYEESLEILKKAKLSLNSMPFFKKGTHERIFASLAAGSVPITSRNLWVDAHFKKGEELILFDGRNIGEIGEKVRDLLANPQKRHEIAYQGQKKTLTYHTWDQRAHILLSQPPEMFLESK